MKYPVRGIPHFDQQAPHKGIEVRDFQLKISILIGFGPILLKMRLFYMGIEPGIFKNRLEYI